MEIRKTECGSVTVFFALILVLIMSLVLVSLEAARSVAMRSAAKLALASAVESAMGDFYRPLFDEYGIFALDTGYGTGVATPGRLRDEISDISEINADRLALTGCRITDMVALTSDGGAEFVKQAVESEKYAAAQSMITALGEKLGLLNGQTQIAGVLKEKAEIEERLAVIDGYTLKLMSIVDGVNVNPQQILEEGRIYNIEPIFVKSFFVREINSVNAGINNNGILAALSGYLKNPVNMARNIAAEAQNLAALAEEGYVIEERLHSCSIELERYKPLVREGASMDEPLPPEYLRALEKLSEIADEYSEYERRKSVAYERCGNDAQELFLLCGNTVGKMEEAVGLIAQIAPIQEKMRSVVSNYEGLLGALEGVISDEVMGSLTDSLSLMKGYIGMETDGAAVDFSEIDRTLTADISLLKDSGYGLLTGLPAADNPEELRSWAEKVYGLAEHFSAFSYDGLSFDYSGIISESTDEMMVDAVESSILSCLSEGWLKLVLPQGAQLSTARMDQEMLPSLYTSENIEETGFFEELIRKAVSGNGADILNNLFETLEAEGPGDLLEKGINAVYDKAMLSMYLHDRFDDYSNVEKNGKTVLEYEQEYLICGNASDQVNLALTVAKIFLIRLMPVAIYVLTNKAMNEEAKAAASVLMSCTGMPFLTILVKYVVLFLWAAEQAIVETAAIIRGGKVPLITTKESFRISISELPAFTKEMIDRNAAEFTTECLHMNYSEYLMLLLMMQDKSDSAGKALNLIQVNLRHAYDDDFLIGNCITGFRAEADFEGAATFIRNPLSMLKDSSVRGYAVTVSRTGSYTGLAD